jgi:hypothetical protein
MTYRIPGSQTLELAATSSIALVAGSTSNYKNVTVANLTSDFTSSGPLVLRTVTFKRFTIKFSPMVLNTTITAGFPIDPTLFAQITATSDGGVEVPMTKQLQLSRVNGRTVSFNVPIWMISPNPVQSPQLLITVRVFSATTVPSSNSYFVAFTVVSQADISIDFPQNF